MKISRRRKHQEQPKEKSQIPRRRKHQEQRKEKTQIPRCRNYQKQSKGKNPKKRKTVERGGGVKVNSPRPRLLNHLHYVGPPERTCWLSGPAGTKNLVRPPLRSCSAPEKEGA